MSRPDLTRRAEGSVRVYDVEMPSRETSRVINDLHDDLDVGRSLKHREVEDLVDQEVVVPECESRANDDEFVVTDVSVEYDGVLRGSCVIVRPDQR